MIHGGTYGESNGYRMDYKSLLGHGRRDWELVQEVIDYIKEQGEDDLYFPLLKNKIKRKRLQCH